MTPTPTEIESLLERPTREQIDAWLTENCGKGLPYGEATNQAEMLHGLAYILRQIEGTSNYKVNIGQRVSAVSALRMALDHFAIAAILHTSSRETKDAD